MLAAAGFSLTYTGFAALCLAMNRHARDILGRELPRRSASLSSAAGWTLIAIALWLCISAAGWSVGLVEWIGVLTTSAVTLALTLTYSPRWTLRLALIFLGLALVAWLFA